MTRLERFSLEKRQPTKGNNTLPAGWWTLARAVCNNSLNPQDKLKSFERSVTVNMSENETAPVEGATEITTESPAAVVESEDISYHAVEKDGVVTAIWEMQGRKHMRTIDPRSRQGQDILRLYTTEHHDETAPAASEAASS
jgi:hypothetical protein